MNSVFSLNIIKWIKEIEDGSVVQFKKSAPVPPANNNLIKDLVYDNFDTEIVKKDGLVIFHGRDENCEDCFSALADFEVFVKDYGKKFPVNYFKYDIADNYLFRSLTRVPEIYLYKDSDVYRYPTLSFHSNSILAWLKRIYPNHHDEL